MITPGLSYDDLGRRTGESGVQLYYDSAGNVIEERAAGAGLTQYVWSAAGGTLLLRDRDTDNSLSTTASPKLPAGIDERLYALQDPWGSMTALVSDVGAVMERYFYSPEGECWITGDAADGSDGRRWSSFGWRYGYHGGRDERFVLSDPAHDGLFSLYSLGGVMHDSLSGGPLQADPVAYWAQHLGYSEWTMRNSIELHGAWATAVTICDWVSTIAFAMASGGASVAGQGSLAILKAGIAFTAKAALTGAVVGGTVSWLGGGDFWEGAGTDVEWGLDAAMMWPSGASALFGGVGRWVAGHPGLLTAGAAGVAALELASDAEAAVGAWRGVAQAGRSWRSIRAELRGVLSGINAQRLADGKAVLRAYQARAVRQAMVSEIRLQQFAERLPHHKIIGRPGAYGTQGADLITFDTLSNRLVLWDAKFRSRAVTLQMSQTFRNSSRFTKAMAQVNEIVADPRILAYLSPAEQAMARAALNKGREVGLRTIGFGRAKNWVFGTRSI